MQRPRILLQHTRRLPGGDSAATAGITVADLGGQRLAVQVPGAGVQVGVCIEVPQRGAAWLRYIVTKEQVDCILLLRVRVSVAVEAPVNRSTMTLGTLMDIRPAGASAYQLYARLSRSLRVQHGQDEALARLGTSCQD